MIEVPVFQTATVEMTRTPARLLRRPVISRELREFMDSGSEIYNEAFSMFSLL